MQRDVRASGFNEGVAFVAGGSGGIGAAITQSLAAAGSDVLFTYYRNQDAAKRVLDAAGREGRRVECVQLALEDGAAAARVLADTRSRFGKIHSVIYAAGPSVPINYVQAKLRRIPIGSRLSPWIRMPASTSCMRRCRS